MNLVMKHRSGRTSQEAGGLRNTRECTPEAVLSALVVLGGGLRVQVQPPLVVVEGGEHGAVE